ncbi:16638_t:CDS:2, partial [Entrophospora sp. SA101]
MSSLGEILGTINDNYNDSDSDITNFISTSMKNISDSFKSITQIIGDDPDKYEETKTLFEETYHKLKREKEEKEEREEKEIIDNDDNKIKNPIPTKTKG